VSKITPGAVVTTTWATVGTNVWPAGIVCDAAGNIFTANFNNNTISKITSDGTVTQSYVSLANGAAPYYLAKDAVGNLYVTNMGNGTVSKVAGLPSVTITSSASGAVCAGTNVTFTAVASNISTPTYQWTKNGIAIAGAYSSTYSSTTLSNNDQIKVWVNAGIDNSKIVSNGLLLNLDASNPGSYSGTGNNWYDLSGNNNHATLLNSPTFDAVSKSVVTNGTNQYINIPSLNTSNSNITMQAWIYFDGSTRPGALIGAKNGYSIGKGDNAYDVAGNNLVLLLYGAAGGWKATGQSYGSSGWKLVTMTLDGSSTARAYIDGTLKYTYSGAAPSTPLGDLNLGAIPEDGYRYYDGKFAAAYFYNRALSLAEIQQNYDAFATKSTGYGSNTITVAVTGATPTLTVTGDGCANKTTLTTTSGLTSYAWYKDNLIINGATSNTYTPTASGAYQVQVTSGSCSNTSTTTTIYACAVSSSGQILATSIAGSIISPEGGANFGTGRDASGKLYNTTGLTTSTSNIGSTTAVLGGVISPTNAITSSVGVVYSTDVNFGTYSSTTIQSNVVAGTYSSSITGLVSSTTYYAKSFIINKAGTSYGNVVNFTTTSPPPPAIGDNYGGGKVFYVFQPGDPGYVAGQYHGLIAATSDIVTGYKVWGCYGTPRGVSTALGTGAANTTKIQACGEFQFAAKLALAVRDGGYSDWYLPSIDELNLLYLNRSLVGGFVSGQYWSSSEGNPAYAYAYYQDFSNGSQAWEDKNGQRNVRAIRSF